MNGIIKSNEEMVVAKIVCGSWSSELDFKSMDGISGKLKEKIDEAMRDTNLNEELVSDRLFCIWRQSSKFLFLWVGHFYETRDFRFVLYSKED